MTVRELIARIFGMNPETDQERLDRLETESRFMSLVSQELWPGDRFRLKGKAYQVDSGGRILRSFGSGEEEEAEVDHR